MTEDEYFALLEKSEQKYEYWNGVAVAMAGAGLPHISIEADLLIALGVALRGGACRPFGSNLGVKVAESYLFPDVTFVCGSPEIYSIRGIACAKNPIAIFEVLSPRTRDIDDSTKLHAYTRLSSLREYVLIDSQRCFVKLYSREDANEIWRVRTFSDLEDEVLLKSIDRSLRLAEVYAHVEFRPLNGA